MKKIISLMLIAVLSLGVLASCNAKPGNAPDGTDKPDDPTPAYDDLYDNLEEAPVSEYDPEEIKATYSVMCDKLGNSTHTQESGLQKIALFSSEDEGSESDKKSFDPADYITDVPEDIVNHFYILKEFVQKGFKQFCNEYAILGKDTLIRIRINDALQELELSIRLGNAYIFYSNYYLNDKAQKHLEYREGDTLCVEYHKFTYSKENGKVAFPVTYDKFSLVGRQKYTLGGEDDLENLDITEAYDTLKYPFIKHIDSQLIQSLLNSSSASIIGERQFRKAVDKTLYNYNYVGEFDIEGLNFSGEGLHATINGNKLVFGSNVYRVSAAVPNIFFGAHGGLYAELSFYTIDRESTEDGIKVVVDRTSNAYLISESVKRTDNGVEFVLKKEIDLSKPARSTSSHTEDVIGSPDETFVAHEEGIDGIREDENLEHVTFAFLTSKNQLHFIVVF